YRSCALFRRTNSQNPTKSVPHQGPSLPATRSQRPSERRSRKHKVLGSVHRKGSSVCHGERRGWFGSGALPTGTLAGRLTGTPLGQSPIEDRVESPLSPSKKAGENRVPVPHDAS